MEAVAARDGPHLFTAGAACEEAPFTARPSPHRGRPAGTPRIECPQSYSAAREA